MTELFNQEKLYKIHIYNIIEESEARGIAKGEARGIAKGEARGEARGIAKGEAKGAAAATSAIIVRYMKNHNVSYDEAMDALGIPELERDMYYSMIKE